MAFAHTVGANTDKVGIRIYTTAFRKIYEDNGLATSAGQHLYTVDLSGAGFPANGFYYLVLVEESGGKKTKKVMKLIVLR